MKTYVLMLSKYFPLNHYRGGQETGFKKKLITGIKIHTIRANYSLWKDRVKEVQEGKALISLRQWEGKPYRSKQTELLQLTKDNGVGIEKFSLPSIGNLATVLKVYPDLDKNDGLSQLDWMNWFEGYDRNKPMAIIHFTPFRYNKNLG